MTARAARVVHVLLLGALLLLFVVGTDLAQQRQLPARPIDAAGYAILVAVVVALGVRNRWPRAVFAVVAGLVAVYLALGYAYGPVFLGASVAAFALSASGPGTTVVGGVVGAVLLWLAVEALPLAATSQWGSLITLAAGYGGTLITPVWLASMRARARDHAAAAAERRRREVGELRLELAREVHDVVAHNLTVIGVQAGAAMRVLDRDPERARECLSSIVATNRQALTELRGTVDMLRGTGAARVAGAPGDVGRTGDTATTHGSGTLADVPALVDSARAAGAPVGLSVLGEPRHAEPIVERAAYRIVQESLTNAMRHAPGAHTSVELSYRGGRLSVRVTDDGPGVRDRPEGRGISGMRERATLANGSLTVGVTGTGGTEVCADLPLDGTAP